jgi:hypothetical protein
MIGEHSDIKRMLAREKCRTVDRPGSLCGRPCADAILPYVRFLRTDEFGARTRALRPLTSRSPRTQYTRARRKAKTQKRYRRYARTDAATDTALVPHTTPARTVRHTLRLDASLSEPTPRQTPTHLSSDTVPCRATTLTQRGRWEGILPGSWIHTVSPPPDFELRSQCTPVRAHSSQVSQLTLTQ